MRGVGWLVWAMVLGSSLFSPIAQAEERIVVLIAQDQDLPAAVFREVRNRFSKRAAERGLQVSVQAFQLTYSLYQLELSAVLPFGELYKNTGWEKDHWQRQEQGYAWSWALALHWLW